MRAWWSIYQNQEKALPLEWWDPTTGLLYNFTTGYTFTFQLVSDGEYYHSKVSGFVGTATSPNLIVALTTNELAAVPPGLYIAHIVARHTATVIDNIFEEDDPPIVEILKTPVLAV